MSQHKKPAAILADNLNPKVLAAEYAVRGEIATRAQTLARDIKEGKGQHPFDKVVWCNIGNPQQLGQRPITFFRQVLSLCDYPELLDNPLTEQLYPSDVLDRAKGILSEVPGGLGAYSDSAGALALRKQVAAGIERRDGHSCDPEDLFLTDGASPAVHHLMQLLLRGPEDALMVPIPQYPLYSATLALYGGRLVPYYLDEATNWSLDINNMRQALQQARQDGVVVRGLVVINPGNPTGQCLTRQNQEDVLRLCDEEGLMLMADEVYQTNVYSPSCTFTSFKKVLREMGDGVGPVPLASMHSTSKGFVGECGRRGGYMEMVNFTQGVKDEVLKLASINLCPNVSGQVCVALMMSPPKPGEPSHELYESESRAILASLSRRARMLVEGLAALPGVTCNEAQGALYAFPRITLPHAAVAHAQQIGKPADWLYCVELLEATGVVVVPGSGFRQADGTWHFRTTILPPEDDIAGVVQKLGAFHRSFLDKYGGLANGAHAQDA